MERKESIKHREPFDSAQERIDKLSSSDPAQVAEARSGIRYWPHMYPSTKVSDSDSAQHGT